MGEHKVRTYNDKPVAVTVDGVQVPSTDFVLEQMRAQGRRIDRAKSVAYVALLVAVAAVAATIILATL